MPLLTLSTIQSKLSTRKTLSLGTDNIGPTTYKQIKKYIKQDSIDFTNCTSITYEKNYLKFEGELSNIWYYEKVIVSCFIFDYVTGTNKRQFLMKLHLPDGEDAYSQIVRLSKWQNVYFFESSVESISFKANTLLFSSIEYNSNKINGQSIFPKELIAYLPMKEVKVGLNGYKVIAKEKAFDFYYFLFEESTAGKSIVGSKDNGSINAEGVLFWENGGLNFLIEKEINKKITLLGIQIILNKIGTWMPLEYESSGPKISWEGAIHFNINNKLQINGSYDPYNNILVASFLDFPTLLDILVIAQEKAHFPDFFEKLLSVKLSSLEMLLNLTRKKVEGVALSLTMEEEIPLIKDLISLKPTLNLEIYYTTKEITDIVEGEVISTTITYKSVKGMIVGDWTLGNKRFETSISYPDLEVKAQMASGEKLSIKDLKGKLLPNAPLPDISITALSVSFNLKETNYIVMNGSGEFLFNERLITLNLGILKLGNSTTIIGGFTYTFKNLVFTSEIEFQEKHWKVAAFYEGDVSLKMIGESFNFSPPEQLDVIKFNILRLSFSSQAGDITDTTSQKQFSFLANSTNKWELGKTPGKVALNRFSLDIDYKGGDKSPSNTGFSEGSIATQIQIGRKLFVDLSADFKSTQEEKGWLFKGSTAMTDTLQEVIQDITTAFEVNKEVPIPDFLQDWQIYELSVVFNTSNKDFEFVFALVNNAAPGLGLTFTLSLLHKKGKPKSYTAKFVGLAIYKTEKIDIAFDLLIEKKVQETIPKKTVSIIGNYKAVKPPKLSDILVAIAQQNDMKVVLPAEMKIDATATGFGIVIKKLDDNPVAAQLAGAFNLSVNKTSNLDFYFAFSNKVTSDAAFKIPLLAKNKKGEKKPAIVFGASMGGVLDLSKLPVVGNIPGMEKLGIDKLGFYYTNAELTTKQQANFQVPQTKLPTASVTGDAKGQTVTQTNDTASPSGLVLNKGGFTLLAVFGKTGKDKKSPLRPIGNLALPLGADTKKVEGTPAFAVTPAKSEIPVKWLTLNKTIGPVSLQKVGLNYSKGQASIGFTGGMALANFTLELEELAITFPMPLPGQPADSKVAFDLKGMSLDIRSGSFELSGGFLKAITNKGEPSFYGQVSVRIGTFGLKALGGYTPATKKRLASFFIYANIEIPLGGPPYLYITGFAGGFGINNELRLPTLENLPSYILLPSNAPKQQGTAKKTMNAVMHGMQKAFIPKEGQYWAAAGVSFSSFEMIKAFAAVTVSFGVDFEIALLGNCSMAFPTRVDKPIAYVEIAIMASFSEASGLLAVQGIISPASYIFGDFCRITGGFAFYIWFNPPKREKGPKAGEFLVTLGGYHPLYTPPAYYPKVPRLGIQFNLGPVKVEGSVYFALIPSMFMAGGYWKLTFDIKIVKAWFALEINFLIGWAPFHYEASLYIRIGCEVNLGLFTISISIGADLLIWGPPLGGIATVDLDIISFEISFGAEQALPPPIGWSDFKDNFLPADQKKEKVTRSIKGRTRSAVVANHKTNILTSSASKGLQGTDVNEFDWILDPDYFLIRVSSAIPINAPFWGDNPIPISNQSKDYNLPPPVSASEWPYLISKETANHFSTDKVWNPEIHIKPMGIVGLNSKLSIRLLKKDASGKYIDPVSDVTIAPILTDSPTALWERPKKEKIKANDPSFLNACLSGFEISPLPRIPSTTKEVLLVDLLYQQGNIYNFSYQIPEISKDFKVISADNGAVPHEHTVDHVHTLIVNILPKNTSLNKKVLENKGYVLQSLLEKDIVEKRSSIINNLRATGFDTLEPVNLKVFATKTALTDWPEVMVLGDSIF